jgi:hypothetical protein
MSYTGLMDGWHGDEEECHGKYCFCEECEQIKDNLGDMQYEQYKFECDSE